MAERYKLIISNEKIYREVPLDAAKEKIVIGTSKDANVRLYYEDLGTDADIKLYNTGKEWKMAASDGFFIILGDKRKEAVLEQKHGVKSKIVSAKDGKVICDVLCSYDYETKPFSLVCDLKDVRQFTIGTDTGCDIILLDSDVNIALVHIFHRFGQLEVEVYNSEFAICHNGIPTGTSFKADDTDFFSIANFSFYYRDEKLYISNRDHVMIPKLQTVYLNESRSSLIYPKFHQNTKLNICIPEETIEILNPPELPRKSNEKLFAHLLPSVIMLIMVIAIRGFMSESGGSNLSYLLFSVCSMGLGICTSIGSYVSDKKRYATEVEARKRDYTAYIERKKVELQEAKTLEESLLNKKYISSAECLERVDDFSGDLFDRIPGDEDFLKIRIGIGKYDSQMKVKISVKDKILPTDELEKIPGELEDTFHQVENVPVVIDLKTCHNLGVIGEESGRYELFKIIALDLSTHTFYKDLKFIYIMDERRQKQFFWSRFLPHLQEENRGARGIVCDEDSKKTQFEWLYKELSWRERYKKDREFYALVVFALDDMGLSAHPISRFFATAHELNVYFISFARQKEQLPLYCGKIIHVPDQNSCLIMDADDQGKHQKCMLAPVSDAKMERMVRRIAPVYCEEISLESHLIKNISLFSLLHIFSAEDLNLEKRWGTQDICKTMRVPLGVKARDEILYLDLHEKADGPHGLVAGTTGSGKSEILQTLILSIATMYSPEEAAFLIIDFKGGGMANQFRSLPHLVGAITDIDGREISRSLLSIRAELDRRKELFADANVNNINSYIKNYKKGNIKTPLPHLIIIVDEFAELKAEQPEFMKELISTSRIGRSLGVHLILATQKPAGQVSDQIWSNARFRLCLKVQTKEDSNEMIKSPLAAEILEPGRAYLQVGNNEVFELFQSAYSGAPEKSEEGRLYQKEYSIAEVDFSGKKTVVFQQQKEKSEAASRSQLEAIVEYVSDYCKEHQIRKLPPVCLPSLPDMLAFQRDEKQVGYDISAGVGLYDAPERQYQGIFRIGITGNNTMIIGSSQYGKTNLLQTIIRQLATNYMADQVNIYIADFGSRIFKNYEGLAHVGGVVFADQEEKFKNLFKMLYAEIAERKEKLARIGVSSYAAYLEAGFTEIPQIVLLIDNLTNMRECYLMEDDVLLPICREGVSVGLSVIVANSQTSGIGYKYLTNFDQRIVFTCNDSTEYSAMFDHCRKELANLPGRCLISMDKNVYEAQTYLAFEGRTEYERIGEIKKFIKMANQINQGKKARKIPEIPSVLSYEELKSDYGAATDKGKLALGLNYADVSPVNIDWRKQNILAISGKDKQSKMGFIRYLKKTLVELKAALYIVDDYDGLFEDISDLDTVVYDNTMNGLPEMLEEITKVMEERRDLRDRHGVKAINDLPPVLLLLQPEETPAVISNDKNMLAMYQDILTKYKELKCMVLFTNLENTPIPFDAPKVLKMMKDNRQFLVFDNLKNIKLFDCPSNLLKKYRNPVEAGDAYWLADNELMKIKTVVWSENEEEEVKKWQ